MRRALAALIGAAALAGCARYPAIATAADPVPAADPTLAGVQYLYGSAEGAAISVQAWNGIAAFAAARVAHRPVDSVVLDEGATLAAPRFVPCGAKPLAAVFDVDETVLLNLGFARETAGRAGPFDAAVWAKWERAGAAGVVPVPGARAGIAALHRLGVAVIFNTNRSAENAAGTEAALNGVGLGPAIHKQTLWLKGDDNTGSAKDVRRWWIADKYCVIAMGGDQLGDFSDLFNDRLAPAERRTAAVSSPIATLWGAGWFALPNPTYGTALKGDYPAIFPYAQEK